MASGARARSPHRKYRGRRRPAGEAGDSVATSAPPVVPDVERGDRVDGLVQGGEPGGQRGLVDVPARRAHTDEPLDVGGGERQRERELLAVVEPEVAGEAVLEALVLLAVDG